ncbi:neuropeptide FF receptor 2-like [Exaiptasia diaphana]|uniref:G-protein coupled receptors family 1 profile domain-containing protein n=1 Tax=Exaiptasia diaphana TaxID=2652724 RepID=A0A913X589_EXADI|nr:neuropeptide FF receptor 2-like [Exaiptasia diaphana]
MNDQLLNNSSSNNSSIYGLTTKVFSSTSILSSSPNLLIAIVTLYFILITAGIVLNSVVCYVMVKRKRYRRNISSFFITHMAGVDLVYRVLLTPSSVYLSLPSSQSKSIPCKTSIFVGTTCAAAVFGSLVVIAIDRYRNIVHPLKGLSQSKRPRRLVLLVWGYAIISSVMLLYTVQNTPQDHPDQLKETVGNPTSCDVRPGLVGGISVMISIVMIFLLPLVTIIVTYSAMFISLRQCSQTGLVHKAAAKSKAKSARMLVLVVIGFVMCFGPSFVSSMVNSNILLGHKNNSQDASLLSIVANLLELCSSLVNPLIYAFYSSDFRKDLGHVCQIPRPPPKHLHTTCGCMISYTL